jgi:hypothetical protein
MTVVRELLAALRDCIDLKAELHLPLVPETRVAISEMEDAISPLKLAMLRHHPDQLELPLEGRTAVFAHQKPVCTDEFAGFFA